VNAPAYSQYHTTIVPSEPTSDHSPPPEADIETFTRRSGPIPVANSDTSLHMLSHDFVLLSKTFAFNVMLFPRYQICGDRSMHDSRNPFERRVEQTQIV
jgi:hypothetical protein